jgi:outer membrane protein OmpA-like peptidoglycan-associated protein
MVWRATDGAEALGLQLSVFLPTGTVTNFGSDGGVGFMPMVTGEWTPSGFPIPLTFIANTGVAFRPDNSVNDPAGHAGPPQGLGIGDEWRWAVGALVPIAAGKYRVGATIFGQTGLKNDSTTGNTIFTEQNTPIEWNAEGRMKVPVPGLDNLYVGAGLGTRILGGYGAPDFRVVGLVGTDWTIEDTKPPSPDDSKVRSSIRESMKDSDNDGIPDDIDACPTEPEDHKPPDPSDGCPAPVDSDNDGIPDAQDACPKVPGKPDPDPKKNGCPKLIKVEGSTVHVLQQVHFETGSATILPDSFPMLTEVVDLLKANPDIKRMRIEGHTDNHGAAAMNLDLSKRRAASVRVWLVQHSISANRLESEGYGLTRPVATNDTDEGRATNRRVEFKIVESGTASESGP